MAKTDIDEARPAEKPIRTPIPKRVRFEVFKRDKFTCQYCGQSAPGVVLHCDHIQPVADGGASDIINLITSCQGCNLGKGAVPLSDGSAVAKQHAMLADLEERRQQIEMMLEWRKGLRAQEADAAERIAELCSIGGWSCSQTGISDIRKWLKRYSAEEICAAIDECFDAYGEWDEDKITGESWAKAFSKIPGMISIKRQEADKPYLRRILYIQGIIRNRLRIRRLDWLDYLEHLAVCGADLDEMEIRSKRMRCREDFDGHYDKWLASIGRTF